MFAVGAVIAFLIAMFVDGNPDPSTSSFWLLIGLIFVAAHLAAMYYVGQYRARQG